VWAFHGGSYRQHRRFSQSGGPTRLRHRFAPVVVNG